jgi:hypothetical protein
LRGAFSDAALRAPLTPNVRLNKGRNSNMNELKRGINAHWLSLLWILICLFNLLLYWKNPSYPRVGIIWVLPLIAHLGYLFWGMKRPYVQIDNNNLSFYLRPWKIIRIRVDEIKTVKGYTPYEKGFVTTLSLPTDRDTLIIETADGGSLSMGPLRASERTRGQIIKFLTQIGIPFKNLNQA